MSPVKMIILRIYGLTLGRINIIALIIKKILVYILIKNKKDNKYIASSKYFDLEEFIRMKIKK